MMSPPVNYDLERRQSAVDFRNVSNIVSISCDTQSLTERKSANNLAWRESKTIKRHHSIYERGERKNEAIHYKDARTSLSPRPKTPTQKKFQPGGKC